MCHPRAVRHVSHLGSCIACPVLSCAVIYLSAASRLFSCCPVLRPGSSVLTRSLVSLSMSRLNIKEVTTLCIVDFASSTRSKKPTTVFGVVSPVCATCGVFLTVPPSCKSTSRFTRKCCTDSNYPLSNKVIEDNLNSPMSCVFHRHLQAFSECSNSLFRTYFCLNLLNCCHSCRQSQSCSVTADNLAEALFWITVHWNVSVMCLQHLQQLLKIFEFCVLSMSGSCKRFLHQLRPETSAPC